MTATGADAALATGGLDALDAYVSRYLPQRVLAVVVPLVVVVALLVRDPVSAATSVEAILKRALLNLTMFFALRKFLSSSSI